MPEVEQTADYVIVGGGLTGCTIASKLSQGQASPSVILLEAGIDASDNPNVSTPDGAFLLAGTDVDWAFKTLADPNTCDRVHTSIAGRVLGGGSVLNYGGWSRGDASDYNDWAKVVGDDRWNYENQLPYFQKSEDLFDPRGHLKQYGLGGPLHISAISANAKRTYGLRKPLKEAWAELGVRPNPQASLGSSNGISEVLENWHHGKRQPAHLAYDLARVQILTNALVQLVLFTKDGSKKATEVVLVDGRRFKAKKEIILTAGAIRTPQLLMLSGIGPQDTLSSHGIPMVLPCPEVGRNLFDHFALYQLWNVRHPEKGLALGTPKWTDAAYANGLPWDWVVNEAVSPDQLRQALVADESHGKTHTVPFQGKSLLDPTRSHLETLVIYSNAGAPVPVNGSLIATSIMLLLPTSRGSITIASASAADAPVITPNYYDTEADRTTLIYGTRRLLHALLATSAGKSYIESEAAPPGMPSLNPQSTDAEIDERIRKTGMAHYHSAGTAAMGKVVDSKLRVYGVQGLRIADASVLPVPIGGHPQATLYGLAEQAADIILQDG